ncbi:MAG: hypothetical protein K2G87_05870 [Oscillospiraceae bacterium]|nr:hypothetical protein [Oscillospiraceae bacterium]
MKKVINICSVLCGIVALLSLVMGIRVLTGGRFFIGLRIFSMAENGTFISFIGNLLGIAVSCLGFGALALYGFVSSQNAKRNSFIYGLIMTAICLISMVASIFSRSFTIGDLFIAVLPAVYTFAVLKSA